jgi:hypothetical protein
MRALPIVVSVAVTAVVSCAAGAFYGKRVTEQAARTEWVDREISLKGIDLHKNLTTLLALREEPAQKLVPSEELWIVERINGLDLDAVTPSSGSSAVLRETANKLLEYRSKYPATTIDPHKNTKVKKLLSFSGPSAFPSNNTVERDARESGARRSQ